MVLRDFGLGFWVLERKWYIFFEKSSIDVTRNVDFLEWDGMEIHLKKCGVTAMDMRNGQRVATDSIILHGQPFPVILPNQ